MGASDRAKSERPTDITELECWQEAREFVKFVYKLTAQESFSADPLLTDLLRRQSIIVMAKISEGHHHRDKEFFLANLNEAIGNLGETISHFYIASDQNYLDREDLNDALNKAYTVGIRITSYVKGLEGKEKPSSTRK